MIIGSLVGLSLAARVRKRANTLGRVQRIVHSVVISPHHAAGGAAERARVVREWLPVGIIYGFLGRAQIVHCRPLNIGGKHTGLNICSGGRLYLRVTVGTYVVIGIHTVIINAFALVVAQRNLVLPWATGSAVNFSVPIPSTTFPSILVLILSVGVAAIFSNFLIGNIGHLLRRPTVVAF